MRSILLFLLVVSCGTDDSNNTGNDTNILENNSAVESTALGTDLEIIDMHFGSLLGNGWTPGETGGAMTYTLAKEASKGAKTIELVSAKGLVVGQSIVYSTVDGMSYINRINAIGGNIIGMLLPVHEDVLVGVNLFNVYGNQGHPTREGYKAIADRTMSKHPSLAKAKKIVLFGDSWFKQYGIFERMTEKLPDSEIVNKGIGGQQTKHLLARFETDVTTENPDAVMIMVGSNDYSQGVPTALFVANVQKLIDMCHKIGAKPYLFTSSVGPGKLLKLSREYVAPYQHLSK